MNVLVTVLAVLGAVVALVVLVIAGFLLWARWTMRRETATQQQELASFPAWGRERGLTYALIDNGAVEGWETYAPFRDFATPGAFGRALHVFRGSYAGHELVVLQLTVSADPRPEAPAHGTLTVAATHLRERGEEDMIAPKSRKVPSVHARGDRATCYLSGPLTQDRAQAVIDRLVAYVEGDPAADRARPEGHTG
ncbi:hypothetical protein [Isoptericola croceus]|uniref:hypothetical protein n=1 Tax=Isoptericola croceus TaxID=3031406 RepID=UPI0023F9C172|nr:hypothetical protein [Isoptericola croceus]